MLKQFWLFQVPNMVRSTTHFQPHGTAKSCASCHYSVAGILSLQIVITLHPHNILGHVEDAQILNLSVCKYHEWQHVEHAPGLKNCELLLTSRVPSTWIKAGSRSCRLQQRRLAGYELLRLPTRRDSITYWYMRLMHSLPKEVKRLINNNPVFSKTILEQASIR